MKRVIQSLFHFFGFELSRFPRKASLPRRDFHFLQLLKKFEIDLVLDVGAANGGYGDWLRTLGYNSRIISFEPLQISFAELVKKTNGDERWNAVNLALGENNESTHIHVAGNLDSSSLLPMLPTHETAAPHSIVTHTAHIEKIKLDNFDHPWLGNSKSIFLKMDVQGYEMKVLEGAHELLNKVKGLQIEMSFIPLYKDQLLFEEMMTYVKSIGFDMYYIRPGFADQEGRLLQCDGIFFRR